jgi:hypothetical protein
MYKAPVKSVRTNARYAIVDKGTQRFVVSCFDGTTLRRVVGFTNRNQAEIYAKLWKINR